MYPECGSDPSTGYYRICLVMFPETCHSIFCWIKDHRDDYRYRVPIIVPSCLAVIAIEVKVLVQVYYLPGVTLQAVKESDGCYTSPTRMYRDRGRSPLCTPKLILPYATLHFILYVEIVVAIYSISLSKFLRIAKRSMPAKSSLFRPRSSKHSP